MDGLLLLIVVLSLACQFLAAGLALRLIRITGTSWGWSLVATGLLLMAIRRFVVLFGVLTGRQWLVPPLIDNAMGLVITLMLLAGVAAIGPLFLAIRRSQEMLQTAHNGLEQQVQTRTAELIRANAALGDDMAEREKAEAAVLEERRRLFQLLSMYERDRKLTAFEIHDGFVQEATGAQMNLQACSSLWDQDPQKSRELLAKGLELLADGIAEARSLISGLRPAILDDFGVIAAIEHLVRDARGRTGIEVEWSQCVQFDRLAPPLETALFRIVQESLTNALRHSQSPRVRILLTQDGGQLSLTVQDWGRGFEPDKAPADRFGLQGIRERARLLGGQAKIESTPGAGTRIQAELPLVEVAPEPCEE